MEYYVYIYLDIRKPGDYKYKDLTFEYQPFYIGKGSGKRYYVHIKESFNWRDSSIINWLKVNTIRKIKRETGKNPKIVRIKNLDEQSALLLEEELIKHFGRIDLKTGFLTNMSEGGESGNAMLGRRHSDETKKKMSEVRKGIKFTEEHKRKLKEAALSEGRNKKLRKHYENISEQEHKNRSEARKKSVEKIKLNPIKYNRWCDRISKANIGKKLSEETKEKLRWYKTEEEKLKAKKRKNKEKNRRAKEREWKRKEELD